MKLKYTSPFALLALVALSGCSLSQMMKMAKEQNLTVEPSPLEVHADTVKFDMTAALPVKMLKKKTIYTLYPTYKYNNGQSTVELEPIEFKASDYAATPDAEPTESRSFSFPYDGSNADLMANNGTLVVVGTARKEGSEKSKSTPEMEVAKGLIITSKLVKSLGMTVYAPAGYDQDPEYEQLEVPFYFEKNSAVLRPTQVRSANGKVLDQFIASKIATKTVTFTGTHSPEGSESINSKLSEDRAKAVEKFYFSKMKQYDYKGKADSIKFENKTIFQDWTGLKSIVDTTSLLTPEQKSEVMGVINGSGSFMEKEMSLQQLPYYQKVLMNKIYPELRKTKTSVLKLIDKKSDAEINVLAMGIIADTVSADTLTHGELLYAATLTPILEEKEKIYEAAVKIHGSWEAYNNLGAVYMQQAAKEWMSGNMTKAKSLLEKSKAQFELSLNKGDNAYAKNNMGNYLLWSEKPYEAYIAYTEASGMASGELSEKVNVGKGSSEIFLAKYDDAINSLKASSLDEDYVLFNLALAQLLSKDFEAARNNFEKAIEKDQEDAMSFYGLAVTYARLGNVEMLASNLSKAVKLDSKLKEYALKDLEFMKFAQSSAFTNALK